MTANNVLIIGGDSLIGGTLADRLSGLGRDVTVTTRRESANAASRIALDLSHQPDTWPAMPDAGVWVICAAVTKPSNCRASPEESFRINVEAIGHLAQAAARANARVIFLSTNQVFDGTVPHRRADDKHCPITEYGRQKAAAEDRVLDASADFSVVRLTKVLEPGFDLMKGWIRDLGQGREISPFSDMVMAPVALDTAVNVLVTIMDKRASGIFQVSGPEDISYADAASHLALRLGAAPALVHPIRGGVSILLPEETPRHTTLDTDRLTEETNIRFPDAFDVLDHVYQLQAQPTATE